MEPSLAGLLVAACLLAVGWSLGATITIALFASIPLSSTAFATLPALGNSSPPVTTLLCLLFLAGSALRPRVASDLRAVFSEQWTNWWILGLVVYAVVGSYLLPRMFEGTTSAFIPIAGVIFELPLSPVSGNVTQSLYFTLGVLTFLALCLSLRRPSAWPPVVTATFAFVGVHAVAGYVNLLGNIAGAGDVLMPIRTSTYALLTETQEGGLFRVAGGCSEASAFAALAIPCLAFCVSYWRRTGSPAALGWGVAHLSLLIVSTSSTAYAGLGLVCMFLFCSVIANVVRENVPQRDLQLIVAGGIGVIVVLAMMLMLPSVVALFSDLLDSMIFKKHLSGSGQERAYWNSQSMKNFFDTHGLGVGLGSSRASSWAVAVLSQTGLVGAFGFGILLVAIWRAPSTISPAVSLPGNVPLRAFAAAMRSSVFAGLLAASISAAAVDPGIFVFAGFAIVLSASALSARVSAPSGATQSRWTPKAGAGRLQPA